MSNDTAAEPTSYMAEFGVGGGAGSLQGGVAAAASTNSTDVGRSVPASRGKPLEACFLDDGASFIARLDEGESVSALWPFLDVFDKAPNSSKYNLMAALLSRRPKLLRQQWRWRGPADYMVDVLGWSILRGDFQMLKIALNAGAKLYYHHKFAGCGSEEAELYNAPTLCLALEDPKLETVSFLVKEAGALDGWEVKYTKEGKAALSCALAQLALACFPSYKRPEQLWLQSFKPEYTKIREVILEAGFCYFWDMVGQNSALKFLLPQSSTMHLPLSDEDSLLFLKRYRAAGFDVTHMDGPDVVVAQRTETMVHHLAASNGLLQLTNWALQELHCPVDTPFEVQESGERLKLTALTVAIMNGHKEVALHLLKRRRASASFKTWGPRCQPICWLSAGQYTDEEAGVLLRALLERDTDDAILQCTCWSDPRTGNPVSFATEHEQYACVEILLDSRKTGLGKLCAGAGPEASEGGFRRLAAPSTMLATSGQWRLVSKMVAVAEEVKVSEPDLWGNLPLLEIAERLAAAPHPLAQPPPRHVLLMLRKRAEREKAHIKVSAVETRVTPASSTNAPEVPGGKVLTKKEEKKKAKKKAAKKKAKAKKKAAKGAAADAGADDASDVDSDSSGSEVVSEEEVEPGKEHLVDSRNAPDLSVMLAVRRAARAREEEENNKKKKEGK
jgi:hypothetical protein